MPRDMNIEESHLNVDKARDRVLTALRIRWPDVSFRVNGSATIARDFGWVFTLEAVSAKETTALTDGAIPWLAVVDCQTGQAFGTARPYKPKRLAVVFERFLTMSRRNTAHWCLTMEAPGIRYQFSISEAVEEAGLVQLAAAFEDRSIS
jgi:hypothetical protein